MSNASVMEVGYGRCLDCAWQIVGSYTDCQKRAEKHGAQTSHSTIAGSGLLPPPKEVCSECGQVKP